MNWDTREVKTWLLDDEYNYSYLMMVGEEMLVKDEYDFRVMLAHEFHIPNKSEINFTNVDVEEIKSTIRDFI